LGILLAGSCYAASGVSLGLFFGPMLLVTFLVPPLVMGEDSNLGRLIVCLSLSAGICAVWIAVANIPAQQAFRSAAVAGAYVLALAGVASLLQWLRLGKIFSAGATVLLGALWLTWPVWLCAWLTGPHAQATVERLTAAHPLMAMNAVFFSRFNFWDRFPLAYQQLTILNQDLLYSLPPSVAPMVKIHGGIGAVGLSLKAVARSVAGNR
jgi:hypothetical protein